MAYEPEVARALLAADQRTRPIEMLLERHENAPVPDTRPRGVIIGDSHAQDLYYALRLAGTRLNFDFKRIRANCQPTVGERETQGSLRFEDQADECVHLFRSFLESPEMAEAEVVVLMAQWRQHGSTRIADTVAAIREHTDAEIIVFGPKNRFLDLPVLLSRHGTFEGFSEFANDHQRIGIVWFNSRWLAQGLEGQPGHYISAYEVFCEERICPVLTPEGYLTVRDNAHWTPDGARLFGEVLRASDTDVARLLFDKAGNDRAAD